MEKRNRIIITVLLFVCSIFMSCTSGGNRSKEAEQPELLGGDAVRYSLCLQENKTMTVSCPIISREKLEIVELNDCVVNQKDALTVSMYEFDAAVDMVKEYKDYNIYFVILEIGCVDYSKAVDATIEKIVFNINGKELEYVTPYLKIRNTAYYEINEKLKVEENSLLISGDFTGIYGYVPDEERQADLMLTSDKDVIIKSYQLQDYLNITGLTANGDNAENMNINVALGANEDIMLKCNFLLDENVHEDNIIKTSQIIIYEYDGEDYLWVYTPGIYIWKDFSDFDNITRYIDGLQ